MAIDKLLQEMTLEEKASLLSGDDFWHTKAVEWLGVPRVMMSDGPHGLRKQDESKPSENDSIKAVCFPAGCATAASFDPALTRQMGEAIGDAAQHERLAVVLGPGVNIKRSPLCGRNFEYFSEDPFLAGEMAVGLISGLQSRGVGASLKHYMGNSQEHRRMSSSSNIDERTLREIYLSAFEKAVKQAKPWTVMCSYNRLNGDYVAQSKALLTDILRREWGFDGLVVSDWGAVADRIKSVEAGLDLEMPSSAGENDRRVVKAVKDGRLAVEAVDECAGNVLKLVEKAAANAKPHTPWDQQAQHQLARELAAQCMVLLKNEDQLLPLSKNAKIAVVGAFAKKPRFQGGGSSHINYTQVASAMDVLGRLPNVSYAEGYRGVEPDETLLAQAEALAAKAEVAVVFAGLPDSFECEGYDRAHLAMPQSHNALIQRVAAANPNTVVVLNNGSPVEMPWLGRVKAVLEAYLTGQAGGAAAADLLLGDRCPCGRLPETFPLRLEDTPAFPWYGGEGDNTDYREGVFVGYRWYDKRKMNVLFPFGYGLSYTTFRYDGLTLRGAPVKAGSGVTVSVTVTNTGSRAGKEVVQVYVAPPKDSRYIRPVRELRGFAKVALNPGESQTVEIPLDSRAFSLWDTTLHDWRIEGGDYTVEIGRSSREIVLSQTVRAETSAALPEHYDMNTTFGDILASEKAKAAFAPLIAMMTAIPQQSAEADEAITPAMNEASVRYAPLRQLLCFRPGMIGYDELEAMIKRANGEL